VCCDSPLLCEQVHRVVVPDDEEMRQKVRRCVVFFPHPDADFVVSCLDGSDTYEPITDVEYHMQREVQTLHTY